MLRTPIPGERLQLALNRSLPPSIRVLSLTEAPPEFHARHSAVRKTYEYRIFPHAEMCSPMLAPWVWNYHKPLDLELMREAAAHVAGTHDFTSFAATRPDLATRNAAKAVRTSEDEENEDESAGRGNTRTIFSSEWCERDGLILYRVTGSGFLHHMVRNLVGSFVEVGAKRILPDAIPAILAARDRRAAGATAPASGLFLVEVEY
jgi:tRNA pseudouridine38-40 synthase